MTSVLRRLAANSKDANRSRGLLSLAAVVDGMNRAKMRRGLAGWIGRRCVTGFTASTPKAREGRVAAACARKTAWRGRRIDLKGVGFSHISARPRHPGQKIES
jgi:hypothetical protein